MSAMLDLSLRLLAWLILAPLVPGVINKVKAWVAGRQGPPVLQLYFDLARLWRKGVVISTLASPGFVIAPAVAWVAVVGAALLLPLAGAGASASFDGDVLLLVYLLALARFCTAWGAMETGSAFEGMGAAREVSYAVLAEIGIITAIRTRAVQSGSVTLSSLFEPLPGPSEALLAVGLFIILLAENCRVPFDDPNTHLELTMIHEVMVLDHGGVDFGFVLWGSALKLWVLGAFLAGLLPPPATGHPLADLAVGAGWLLLLAVATGVVESVMARVRLLRVPQLLVGAGVLCALGLLITFR